MSRVRTLSFHHGQDSLDTRKRAAFSDVASGAPGNEVGISPIS